MATQREYNILFSLGAKLGQGFNETFSSAKSAMQKTQQEIKELNNKQNDISSFQKQQAAVEQTARKLSDLRQQHENIQRELEKTGNSSSALQNKLIDKQRAIDKTSQSLQNEKEKLDQMEQSLRDAGIDANNLGEESKKLAAQIDVLADKNEKAAEEANEYGKTSEAFKAVGDALVAAGIVEGLNRIYEAYKECVSIASDFQSTMSSVEALSGANAQEMAALQAEAKDLGATTKFTATESAEAMTYMGMAGWNASEMLSGMDGVLQLAAASGEDLAQTSDIVTDSLTAFGLKASDTAHFADVLAATATNSNTNVGIMGETFKQSASIAGALGYSIEDVSVAIGLMANSGVKGSIAGTALKNTFNGLLDGATLTADAIGEVEFSSVNADGTMKSFGETIDELRGYFNQMSEAEQVANARLLAGNRSYNGLLAILNATDEEYTSLRENIENCSGSAQKMAEIKMDNLNGQVTLLNSATDALKTTIGEAFMPELQAVAEIGTAIVSGINTFMQEHPVLLKSIIAIGTEALVIVGVYKAYTTAKKVMTAVKALNTALTAKEAAAEGAAAAATAAHAGATVTATGAMAGFNAVLMAHPIGMVIAAVGLLTAGLIGLSEATKSQTSEADLLSGSSREQYLKLQDLNAEYETTCEKYGETSAEAIMLKRSIDENTAAFEASKMTLEDFHTTIDEVCSAQEELTGKYSDVLKETTNETIGATNLIQKLHELATASDDTAGSQSVMKNIIAELNDMFPELGLTMSDAYGSFDALTKKVGEAANNSARSKEYQTAVDNLADEIKNEKQLKKALEEAESNYLYAGQKYREAGIFAGTWAKLTNSGVQAQLDEAQEEYRRAEEAYRNNQNEIQEYQRIIKEYESDNENTFDGAKKDTELYASNLLKALKSVEYGYFDTAEAATYYGVNVDELQGKVDELEAYQESLEKGVQAVHDGFMDAADAAEAYGVTAEAIDISDKIQTTIEKINDLGQAYNDVKDAAENSIKGQYDLWDTAAVVIPSNIESINTSLETQQSYWSDYNTDLSNLLDRAEDIDGLGDVIASFADGSEDSVNAIAGMADASDADLQQMVDNWKKVQKQQEEASNSIAELSTDFSDKIGEMKKELEDSIEDLDLNEESAAAAESTINAYIAAIEDGTDDAVAAAEALSTQVAIALKGKADNDELFDANLAQIVNSTSSVANRAKQIVINGYTVDAENTVPGYAVGTDSAARGWALTGEKGPELIQFDGGEKVYTAEETKEILRLVTVMPKIIQMGKELPGYTVDAENTVPGYAVGTDSAARGWALTGEKGPELIQFGSNNADIAKEIQKTVQIVSIIPFINQKSQEISLAEKQYPISEQSAKSFEALSAVQGGAVNITIAPTFTVEGSVNSDDMEARLREYNEVIISSVMEALDEAGIDAKRGAYA